MSSIFTKIINNELPSIKVFESDNIIAIMDLFPLRRGHVLVISKAEVDKMYDLDEKTYTELMNVGRKISLAMDKALECKKVAMSVIGLEVPHAHLHLIPINEINDTNFVQPKLEISKEELQEIADKIKSSL